MDELFSVTPEQKAELEALISEGTTLSERPVGEPEKTSFCEDVASWSNHVRVLLKNIDKELVIMFESTFGNVSAQDAVDDIQGQVFLGVTFLESLMED